MSVRRVLEIGKDGLTRPEIHPGARLTEKLWNAAHGSHTMRAQLQATAHGYGILSGLRVGPTQPESGFIAIQPGLALDPFGRVLLVGDNERDQALRHFPFPYEAPRPGTSPWLHLIMEFEDKLSEGPSDSDNQYERVLEYARCRVTHEVPIQHQIELARVLYTMPDRPIRAAADPHRPGENEIDLRFRTLAACGVQAEVVLGQVSHGGGELQANPHHRGLAFLARHLRLDASCQVRFHPEIDPAEHPLLLGECDLLYLSGEAATNLGKPRIDALRRYVRDGGFLLAESCNPRFAAATRDFAAGIGARLTRVEERHPALSALYVFGTPPDGGPSDGGELEFGVGPDGRGGVFFSNRDYGCAWEGAGSRSRAVVRDALELGANLAIFAVHARESGHPELPLTSPASHA